MWSASGDGVEAEGQDLFDGMREFVHALPALGQGAVSMLQDGLERQRDLVLAALGNDAALQRIKDAARSDLHRLQGALAAIAHVVTILREYLEHEYYYFSELDAEHKAYYVCKLVGRLAFEVVLNVATTGTMTAIRGGAEAGLAASTLEKVEQANIAVAKVAEIPDRVGTHGRRLRAAAGGVRTGLREQVGGASNGEGCDDEEAAPSVVLGRRKQSAQRTREERTRKLWLRSGGNDLLGRNGPCRLVRWRISRTTSSTRSRQGHRTTVCPTTCTTSSFVRHRSKGRPRRCASEQSNAIRRPPRPSSRRCSPETSRRVSSGLLVSDSPTVAHATVITRIDGVLTVVNNQGWNEALGKGDDILQTFAQWDTSWKTVSKSDAAYYEVMKTGFSLPK